MKAFQETPVTRVGTACRGKTHSQETKKYGDFRETREIREWLVHPYTGLCHERGAYNITIRKSIILNFTVPVISWLPGISLLYRWLYRIRYSGYDGQPGEKGIPGLDGGYYIPEAERGVPGGPGTDDSCHPDKLK